MILDDLHRIFSKACCDFEAELVEFDGEEDSVHLRVYYPPKIAISSLVNSLKGVSSRMIRKKNYPSIRQKLGGSALWSPSYFTWNLNWYHCATNCDEFMTSRWIVSGCMMSKFDSRWVRVSSIRHCKGIVVNRGSRLAHSAIVAREYDMPYYVMPELDLHTLKDRQFMILAPNGLKPVQQD